MVADYLQKGNAFGEISKVDIDTDTAKIAGIRSVALPLNSKTAVEAQTPTAITIIFNNYPVMA